MKGSSVKNSKTPLDLSSRDSNYYPTRYAIIGWSQLSNPGSIHWLDLFKHIDAAVLK